MQTLLKIFMDLYVPTHTRKYEISLFLRRCLYFMEALSTINASKTNVDSALTKTSYVDSALTKTSFT